MSGVLGQNANVRMKLNIGQGSVTIPPLNMEEDIAVDNKCLQDGPVL